MTARPVAVRNGSNPPTATLVIGTEKENSSTPTNAHTRPARTRSSVAAPAASLATAASLGASAGGRAPA